MFRSGGSCGVTFLLKHAKIGRYVEEVLVCGCLTTASYTRNAHIFDFDHIPAILISRGFSTSVRVQITVRTIFPSSNLKVFINYVLGRVQRPNPIDTKQPLQWTPRFRSFEWYLHMGRL